MSTYSFPHLVIILLGGDTEKRLLKTAVQVAKEIIKCFDENVLDKWNTKEAPP